ncbi:MAG: amidohydrolase family protein, partial [Bradymonadaceae bacterium]
MHDRTQPSLIRHAKWLAIIAIMLLSVACGKDPVDRDPVPTDAGFDTDVWEGDADEDGSSGSEDVEDDAETDTDPVDPIDPGGEVIECERPIAPPTSGELCDVTPGTSGYTLIHGTILAGTKIYKEGYLLIDDARPNATIACVGCDCADEADAADATIMSCAEGVVSPGLINPHDHITFSLSHPQPHGEERFDHRHDWRTGARGSSRVSTSPGSDNSHEGILYGELRMLFGGATSVAGSIGSNNASGLLRNLDNVNHTEGLSGIDVSYRTFPLGDTNGTLRSTNCDYPNIDGENRLNTGIYLPHISEGIDNEARNEFHCLSGASGSDLIRENTSIIHGIGLNALDVALMAERGAMLVWSPRTNIDLYGNTAKIPLFKNFGIPIGLGTDWSASGSMNMLRELQCADYLNTHHFNFTFNDLELWQMATYGAAITMGASHKIGLLFEGYVADVTIFDGTSRQPYRAVIDADTADVSLVLRGGEPLYGDANIVEGLVPPAEIDGCEFIDVCSRERRLCVERDAGKTLGHIRNAVHQNAYALFFCGEPDNEPSC